MNPSTTPETAPTDMPTPTRRLPIVPILLVLAALMIGGGIYLYLQHFRTADTEMLVWAKALADLKK